MNVNLLLDACKFALNELKMKPTITRSEEYTIIVLENAIKSSEVKS